MKQLMENVCRMLRHNSALTAAVVVAGCMMLWVVGCESTTTSLIDPQKKVTRIELRLEASQQAAAIQAELDTLELKVTLAEKKLDQIDALKQQAAEIGVLVAQGGTVNPVGVAMAAMGILGVGAVVDNRKKDGLLTPNPNAKKKKRT